MAGFAEMGISQVPSTSNENFPSRRRGFKSKLLARGEVEALSDCLDLVEVPGEPEWKLRCLTEAFPQYCWKYVEPEVLAHYHYNVALCADAPAMQAVASLPVFYAHLFHSFSPYNFSVQPKSLDRARERLYMQIQAAYNSHNDFDVSIDQMCIGAACVAQVAGRKWLRARIREFTAGNDVLVDLVDIGNDNIVSIRNIRPLLKVFGRLPPLAMRCRMKDVSMNDLTTEKVSVFQKLINSFGGLVRVELADVSAVPFLVNLYHPTVQGSNLGALFYRRKGHDHEAARQRRWDEKQARMKCDFPSDEDSSDESSENDCPQPTHILHLERLQRPVTDEMLFISHIENSRFIYLHSEYHKQALSHLEERLLEKWSELDIITQKWLVPTVACAYADNDSIPCRVIVAEVGDAAVWIRSADHGWKKCISKMDCLAGSLRLLTREFSETPHMYVCRLPSSVMYHPHQSETDILRSLLPVGAPVSIRCYRPKRTLPIKADFFFQNGESVLDALRRLKAKKRLVHPCFELVPYKPLPHVLLHQVDCNYSEDLELFQPFAKGRLEYAYLSEPQ